MGASHLHYTAFMAPCHYTAFMAPNGLAATCPFESLGTPRNRRHRNPCNGKFCHFYVLELFYSYTMAWQ